VRVLVVFLSYCRQTTPIDIISYFLFTNRPAIDRKGNAIPVTGLGGPWGCEMSRLPHFLDSRVTDGIEIVSLTRRPAALYHQEDSGYSFLLEAESTPGPQCGWKN
jgi:hypothetical protein